MYDLAKLGGYLLSPLTAAMLLGLLAWLLLAFGKRRAALWLGLAGYAGLWIASMPATAIALVGHLESRYPAQPLEAAPRAAASVVLGGALSGAYPPVRPSFVFTPAAGRVWHAAALYHAGKAPLIIVAAGNRPHEAELQPEAQAIGEMLRALGVPAHAIRLEGHSRNTRENAEHALAHAQAAKARAALLVTSAMHMDRALLTFQRAWQGSGVMVIPAPTDYRVVGTAELPGMWFPTASALSNVTSALKEFAGKSVLAIM